MEKQPFERTKSADFVKCLAGFFKRDLISIPLIKKYPHQSITQRCNLKAATLELDTAAYPNIEYIAGTRLSVYPPNPQDHVASLMKYLVDDVGPSAQTVVSPPPPASPKQSSASKQSSAPKATSSTGGGSGSGRGKQTQQQQRQSTSNLLRASNIRQLDDNWGSFIKSCGRDSLRLALIYLYDITTAPTRQLIQIMAENCSNKEHRAKLSAISASDESWENWVCQTLRTIKSTFEEFDSCSLSAKALLSELNFQQPRQYSISSIKSTKRFRSEIIVFQHKFTPNHIYNNIQNVKESEQLQGAVSPGRLLAQKTTKQLVPAQQAEPSRTTTGSSKSGIRSIRSMAPLSSSPISTHQVSKVPSYSGPLMNMYVNSTISSMGSTVAATKSAKSTSQHKPQRSSSTSSRHSTTAAAAGGPTNQQQQQNRQQRSSSSARDKAAKPSPAKSSASLLSQAGAPDDDASNNNNNNNNTSNQQPQQRQHRKHHRQQQPSKQLFDGLCSNYLLNLNPNDHIVCEFVENPRFTLKGNRERPIMMIGQDVGVVAFRTFWQQRNIEHDRAQVFYTLFKDLSRKKFGDMQLVCLVGNRCKVEDLFRNEINSNFANKILSAVLYVNRTHFEALLEATVKKGTQVVAASSQLQPVPSGSLHIDSKELIDLGDRIYKLLIEQNGCLYTCCDAQMTQAIEILTVESIARNNANLTRERIMTLLPHWKGRGKTDVQPSSTSADTASADNNFLYTLENQFERARIVQEIYDSSI